MRCGARLNLSDGPSATWGIAMDDDQRSAREEAKKVIRNIRREAAFLRSVVAETQQQLKASRQLLAQVPTQTSTSKNPAAPLKSETGQHPLPHGNN